VVREPGQSNGRSQLESDKDHRDGEHQLNNLVEDDSSRGEILLLQDTETVPHCQTDSIEVKRKESTDKTVEARPQHEHAVSCSLGRIRHLRCPPQPTRGGQLKEE
jgi:hypothetical protein